MLTSKAFFVVALATVATLVGCDAPCENEVVANTPSPSGELSAVVFHRNCAATTGFNTLLSIVRAKDPASNEAGNAFIAEGTIPLKIQWQSEMELSVSGIPGAKVFKQEKRVGGVAVVYK